MATPPDMKVAGKLKSLTIEESGHFFKLGKDFVGHPPHVDAWKPFSGNYPAPHSESSNKKGRVPASSGTNPPVGSMIKGPSVQCKKCHKKHPPESFCPCDICYKVHHPSYCSYLYHIPKGVPFSRAYELCCQCGNPFNEDKWACTFCPGNRARLIPKYCSICNVFLKHCAYECPKDKGLAASYKLLRDQRRPMTLIPY